MVVELMRLHPPVRPQRQPSSVIVLLSVAAPGQADRVLRNSCRHDWPGANPPGETANLAHQLFDILHQHFPNSP